MEKEKTNILPKIILAIIIFLIGGGVMYALIAKYPKFFANNTTHINKNVTVTDTGIADAVEKVYDSVVIVSTYIDNKLYATGTGFVYKKDKNQAYILTNNHVIESGNKVKVAFTNGKDLETEIVGSDALSDIAVLSVKASDVDNVALIGKSDNVRVGDTTFAVGAPLDSTYSWTVTRGIISGKDRMVEVELSSDTGDYVMKVLQTDTAINSGNSGGPLCNANGEVIGITSLKLVDESVEGMGFAIPIEIAIEYASKIENNEKITHPYLGASFINVSDIYHYPQYKKYVIDANVTEGVLVVEVVKNSSAAKAGLQTGDIITKINDDKITSVAYLRYYLYNYNVNDKVTITYIRDGKEATTKVTLQSNNKSY